MERWASPYLAAQAAYLRHLGTAPVAEVVERGGVYAVRTGVAPRSASLYATRIHAKSKSLPNGLREAA